MEKTLVIITLFSADTVRLDEESAARVLQGDYPVRVKSKLLATIRENTSSSDNDCVVGFLPFMKDSGVYPIPVMEDITQDHYGELALYLAPEAPCSIVSDLIARKKDGTLECRKELIDGNDVIVIGDACRDWSDVIVCLDEAGAESVKCISILED